MFATFQAALLPALVCAALHGTPAQAQPQASPPAPPGAPAGQPKPADPTAAVPALVYSTPLRHYQGFVPAQVAPWRDSNALVQQRGGWRAYAREAREAREAGEARQAGDTRA